MDPMLFIVVSLLVPSIIALLALRFGADSRPSHRSSEQALALGGVEWDDDLSRTPVASGARSLRLASARGASAHPTLAMLDRTRGPESLPFAQDPHADRLEERARQLVDEYWSDTVWLTGLVPDIRFRTVCAALEQERLDAGPSMALLADMMPTPGTSCERCKSELAAVDSARHGELVETLAG